jgi:hypothetical protein
MQHDADHEPAVERTPGAGRAKPHGILRLRERIGDAIGRSWAPAVAAIARMRNARMFHPEGHTFSGRIERGGFGPYAELGQRLEGHVLARYSQALWRNESEHLDVLGVALRIRPRDGEVLDHRAKPGDQDLLFATIRSPLTMVLSPFTTDASDFVGNRYWAVSPFEAPPIGRVELRLSPVHPPHPPWHLGGRGRARRIDRLRQAVGSGRAVWLLEARRTLTIGWFAVAELVLEREVKIDQAALRFDPFRTGAGVEPVGLVHAIRRATYAASQAARPH